jgi:hypothetical protein
MALLAGLQGMTWGNVPREISAGIYKKREERSNENISH